MSKGLDYLINLKDGSFSGTKNAKAELQGLDNAVERTGKGMGGLGSMIRNVGGIIAATFAIGAITAFGSASVASYKEVEMAASQVNQGIISTGGAAGRSIEDMVAQANKLENTTLFGDDQILGAQSMLVTFTKIKGAVFDEAIPAIADMAARMGGDLKGAAIQVGKALNDPIAGITALSRVGVSFTASQKATIEHMVKTNNLAGAQALILNELNTEFGGSAAAARDAAGGKADYLVAVGNLQEGFGELVSGGLDPFYESMTGVIEVVSSGVEWFKNNIELMKDVGAGILVAAGAYGVYQAYILALQAPMAMVTAAQWAWNLALNANPIGLIVAGVALLAGGLYIAYKRSETFRAGISGIIEVGRLLGDVFMGVGKQILGALTFNPDMMLEGVRQTVKVAQEIAGGGIGKAFNKGFDRSIAETRATEKQSAMDKLAAAGKKTTPLKGAGAAGSGAESTTVATNKQVRNVNVTIGKLVENLTVATTNLQGAGSADLKRMITEILTGAVHDSELALSSE